MESQKITLIYNDGTTSEQTIYYTVRDIERIIKHLIKEPVVGVLLKDKPPIIQEEPHG